MKRLYPIFILLFFHHSLHPDPSSSFAPTFCVLSLLAGGSCTASYHVWQKKRTDEEIHKDELFLRSLLGMLGGGLAYSIITRRISARWLPCLLEVCKVALESSNSSSNSTSDTYSYRVSRY